jgi:hypothetical protein
MSQLSEQVLGIAVTYLGPAAKIFLERQTTSHMNGLKFDDLQKNHLADLAKWVGNSASLVIDKAKAKELSEKIAKL